PEEAKAIAAVGGAAPHYAATPARGSPVAWMLGIVIAALLGYVFGRGVAAEGVASEWAGIAIGLLLLIVALLGFEYGRRSAAPVVTLDAKLLARLLSEDRQ